MKHIHIIAYVIKAESYAILTDLPFVIFSTKTKLKIVFFISLVYNNTKNSQFQAYFVFL